MSIVGSSPRVRSGAGDESFPGHLSRPRITDILLDHQDSRVRMICAPANSGKTRALHDWRVRSEADGAAPPISVSLPRNCGSDPTAAVLEQLDERYRAGVADASTATVVVDDDGGLAPDDVLRLIDVVLDHPASPKIIIASNEASPSLAHRWGAPLITRRTLNFTSAEVASFAAHMGVRASPRLVEEVWRVTEGWPLAVHHLLDHVGSADPQTWHDMRDFISPVASRILQACISDADIAGLSIAAVPRSCLKELQSSLANPAVLDDAVRFGLGWWEPIGSEQSFVFQPLLRRHLLAHVDDRTKRATLARIARWNRAAGKTRAAFAAAIEASDWTLAHEVASEDFIEVTALLSDEPRLLSAVPKSVLRETPLLNMLFALGLYIEGRTRSAIAAFATMIADVERRKLIGRPLLNGDQIWLHGLLTVGLRLVGRYELVKPALRRFTEMLAVHLRQSPVLEPAEDLFYTEAAVTSLFLGDAEQAIELLDSRPIRVARTKRQHFYGDALRLLALTDRGEFLRASEGIEELRESLLAPGFMESFYAIPFHLACSRVARENGDVQSARRSLSFTARHWSTAEYWPFLLHEHSSIAFAESGPQAAAQTFTTMQAEQRGRAQPSAPVLATITALHADLLAASGHLRDAFSALPGRSTVPEILSARARLHLLNSAPEAALAEVDRAVALGAKPLTLIELHLSGASAASRLGARASCAHHVSRTEHLLGQTGARSVVRQVVAADRQRLAETSDRMRVLFEAIPPAFEEEQLVPHLTKRERLILRDISRGISMPASAHAHSVSINTVKSQRRSLYRKLGVSSAEEAHQRGRKLGLL